MKKILMVMMMVFTVVVGLFAYEPKKEKAKVKRNGDVIYYEKTEPYNIYGFEPDPKARDWDGSKTTIDYDKWVIRKGYTVDQCVDYNYKRLERFRGYYLGYMEEADHPEVTSLNKFVVDLTNEVNGTNETYEEHASNLSQECAWYAKRTAVISIPFVTEENFLTLTKEEMLAKMYAFISECTK